jgi:CrcB protein
MLTKLLFVGMGGVIGSIIRFLIANASVASTSLIPIGTLIANTLGCFLIGFIGAYVQTRHFAYPNITALVFSGFLGSLTTFSTFSFETFNLLRDGHFLPGILNILIQLGLCMFMVWCGFRLMYLLLN